LKNKSGNEIFHIFTRFIKRDDYEMRGRGDH